MATFRKHIDALLYALRVARMVYRNELRAEVPDGPEALPF